MIVELLAEIRRTVELVAAIQTAATLSVVGFLLMAFAFGSLYRVINTEGEPKPWLKIIMGVSLCCGILFSVAGPAIALLSTADTPIKTAKKDEIFSNLRTNSRVNWLIRLIPYYPDKQGNLAVSNLKNLGSPDLKYVFVGAYEELKGQTVERAIAMVGGNYQKGQRVSAIIFAVSGRYPITPANSRGLLQVVRKIEADPASNVLNKLIKVQTLNDKEINNLNNEEIHSWSFDSYSPFFNSFCNLTHKLRCEKAAFDVHQSISSINSDWHPAGAASTKQVDPCSTYPKVCDHKNWDEITNDVYTDFGARVFLIENKSISDLSNRYLIDFESPDTQFIPEIGNVIRRQ